MTGLVRYFVLFVIELGSRRVHVAGIAHDPSGAWIAQLARNLTDAMGGFLRSPRYLIHDRDPLFTEGPFVGFDCTTVAPNLAESQLFGKTANSGSARGRKSGEAQPLLSAFRSSRAWSHCAGHRRRWH
jgi:hypothetical protein